MGPTTGIAPSFVRLICSFKGREKVMKATGGKQQPWDYGSLTGGELVLSRVRANKP
jgi:hypothetical protein